MIPSARPTASPVATIIFCCFVWLDLKSWDGRTDEQHVRKQWSLPAVIVGRLSGSILQSEILTNYIYRVDSAHLEASYNALFNNALPFHYLHPLSYLMYSSNLAQDRRHQEQQQQHSPPIPTSLGNLPLDLSSSGSTAVVERHTKNKTEISVQDWSIDEVVEFVASVESCTEYALVSRNLFIITRKFLYKVIFWKVGTDVGRKSVQK